ncbi:unnamed protein product [Effrenium voratum]|nr:unnamed protein product [Effrenium voratum]
MAKQEVRKAVNVMPEELYEVSVSEAPKFVAFKVEADLDWAKTLAGAKITFGSQGAELQSGEMLLRRPDKEWSQYLCLAPASQGDPKLVVAGLAHPVFQLCKPSKKLQTAEKWAEQTGEALQIIQEAEDALKKGRRAEEAQQRQVRRGRLGLPELREALGNVGWDLTAEMEPVYEQDAWNGAGKAPKRKKAQKQGVELQGTFKIQVVQATATQCTPVGFWSLGDLQMEDLQDVTFRRYETRKLGHQAFELLGKAKSCELRLFGKDPSIASDASQLFEQLKTQKSHEAKDQETKRHILPRFQDADEPINIYAEGLADIASDANIAAHPKLLNDSILAFLKKPPVSLSKLAGPEGLEICETHTAMQVLHARSKQGKLAPEKDLPLFVKKLGVLNLLVNIFKKVKNPRENRFNRVSEPQFCKLLRLDRSKLSQQLHRYLFDPIPHVKVRKSNPRKLLCTVIIWALHLTPELWMDVTGELEHELGLQGMVNTAFEYVGCRVDAKKENGGYKRVILKHAPRFNSKVHEMQKREPKSKAKK